jgi:hypothetical protein
LGLGIAVVLLWLYARNHKWLANIREAAITGSQILTDPSNLPELLFGIGLLVVLTLWWLPKLQAARSRGVSDENRFDRENEARKTLAQIIGGVFVLAGLYSSVRTFDLQRESENLQREGQITDRFTKAIEQLGALAPGAVDKAGKPRINLEVRFGGIYALERISHDSPKDQWTIMEVLTSYVHEHAGQAERGKTSGLSANGPPNWPPPQDIHPEPDIQAILTVIGRRDVKYDAVGVSAFFRILDLREADLRGADLSGAFLDDANLDGAQIFGAGLSGALRLTQKQIDSAWGDAATKVPAGLHKKPKWK